MDSRNKRINKNFSQEKRKVIISFSNICQLLQATENPSYLSFDISRIDAERNVDIWEGATTGQYKIDRKFIQSSKNPVITYECSIENFSLGGYCLSGNTTASNLLKVGQLVIVEEAASNITNWGLGQIRWSNNDVSARFGVQIFGFNPAFYTISKLDYTPIVPIYILVLDVKDVVDKKLVFCQPNKLMPKKCFQSDNQVGYFKVGKLVYSSSFFECYHACKETILS